MESNNAIKLLHDKKDPYTKDGDGDDGEIISVEKIEISAVTNGWIVHTMYENGDEFVEVFDVDGVDNGNRQAVECIMESMGISHEIKLKD